MTSDETSGHRNQAPILTDTIAQSVITMTSDETSVAVVA